MALPAATRMHARRFLFTVWPYPGHLEPTLAVAETLSSRGHEVGVYTGGIAADEVAAAGARLFPFDRVRARLAAVVHPPADDATDQALYRRVMEYQGAAFRRGLLRRGGELATAYADTVLGTVRAQLDDLWPVVRLWRPDVIVTDPDMWAPFLVLAELADVPVCVFSYYAACLIPGPGAPPFGFGLPSPEHWRTRLLSRAVRVATDLAMRKVGVGARAIRREHGLPPTDARVYELMARVPLHVVASVREVDFNRRDLPPSVHYVGACARSPGSAGPAPPWLAAMADPLVYVSEGTTYVGPPIVLRAAARGLGLLACSVIMSTGRQRELTAGALGGLAGNTRLEQWVPQAAVLSRARVFVTHGGGVSILGALRLGVPLVVVPLQWEQADNAQRVVECGAGVRLDPGRCTPRRLRDAVEHVLLDPSYASSARRIAAALASAGGGSRAADLFEQVAARRPMAAAEVQVT